ncbi:MltA domain-containing protein [Rhodoferax sp.]|uniref:murein transglycosylase A n=1 Tax=Rhodoferax sp. TaxID=50421 RepID=UPI001A0B669E|nr:MltA domain-containing protein [Rhodoferax sp.]MBE0474050.1 MltA domain-containing protein [Rhodoferax sp.]
MTAPLLLRRTLAAWLTAVLALVLAACGTAPAPLDAAASSGAGQPSAPLALPDVATSLDAIVRGNSRWQPVAWSELPGFDSDTLFEAWNAWLKSCERPGPVFASLCQEVRRLSIGSQAEQRQWLLDRLQPYRVEPLQGGTTSGLLTAYFEPELQAQRLPGPDFTVPLYQLPANLKARQPWFSRQEIDTLATAKEALRGREIVYLSDPVQAMVLQIQGSGRVRVTEPDGSVRLIRLAYAGHNGHPYQSIGRWLLDQRELRDATWPGIRAWLRQNPQRVNELLWRNPRVVFFKEERLSEFDAAFGPRGAQGVPLTPGRSIAVDPQSIPYGTPVWLASEGPQITLQRLVLAQDTGSAIRGAVRADYFAGWGEAAGELAGRLKQPLRLWVLWPKGRAY